MTNDIFYDLYHKLVLWRNEPTKFIPLLNELAIVCRERKKAASSSDEWLAEADNCLDEVVNYSTLFAAAVSNWLTVNENIELGNALAHKASVRHLQQPGAEFYDLSNIDEASAILAGCRLCARAVTPAVSLGWTLSLAVSHPKSDDTGQAVEHLLQYHVEEYPRTTWRLLSFEDSAFKSEEKAKKALAALEKEEYWLEGLPSLCEFAMSPEMRLALSSVKRRENRDIDRHSRELSIFSQFVATQHFKYATNTAVEFIVGEQVHETTLEMSPYSVSIELPLSELTDPESAAERRRKLWRGVLQ
jgi:hypothetical protein